MPSQQIHKKQDAVTGILFFIFPYYLFNFKSNAVLIKPLKRG